MKLDEQIENYIFTRLLILTHLTFTFQSALPLPLI